MTNICILYQKVGNHRENTFISGLHWNITIEPLEWPLSIAAERSQFDSISTTLTTWFLVKNEWLHPNVNSVWHLSWNCIIVARLLPDYTHLQKACGTGGAGHAYLSEAPNVTPGFLEEIILLVLFLCDVLFPLSSVVRLTFFSFWFTFWFPTLCK